MLLECVILQHFLDKLFLFSISQPVDYETKRSYTLKVEGSNPHVDPQYLAWGPYKDEATIKVRT